MDAPDIEEIVWGLNESTQLLFRTHFGAELALAAQTLSNAYAKFQELQTTVVLDERNATVQLFIHVALSSVISSLHHLVSGYPIASGHMMRHFTESIAMALMCSNEATGVYQVYQADPGTFAVQKAPEMLRKKKIRKALAESMSFDPEAWETVLKMAELYDTLSHASATTLGFHMLFTEEGGLILGSEFDPAKIDQYRSDVVRRRSAAQSLAHIIPIIMGSLPKK